jgi:Ca-activated chloride channel family protein
MLADLELDFGRVDVEDVYPYPLPDLFAGTQLVVVGRYRDGGETDVTLQGVVNDRPQTFRYDDLAFKREGGAEFIARLWATRKIGYLLQQIRLKGEDTEVVDEIVELSVRYGIITPYTSFLVEETERALSEEGRQSIADEAQATAMPAAPSGQQTVERSVGEKALSEAEAPAAPALPGGLGGGATDQYGNVISPVKYVGDKTFVLNSGVWTDTTFDAGRMVPVSVGLYSDDYFALVAAHPEWGRHLAVGDHVIVVLDGTAYEVREGEAPPLVVPTAEPTQVIEASPLPTAVEEPVVQAEPTVAPVDEPVDTPEPQPGEPHSLAGAIAKFFVTVLEKLAGFLGR